MLTCFARLSVVSSALLSRTLARRINLSANHSGMGSSVTITDATNSAPELVMPSNVYTQPSNYVYVDEAQTSVATFTANDSDGDDDYHSTLNSL